MGYQGIDRIFDCFSYNPQIEDFEKVFSYWIKNGKLHCDNPHVLEHIQEDIEIGRLPEKPEETLKAIAKRYEKTGFRYLKERKDG